MSNKQKRQEILVALEKLFEKMETGDNIEISIYEKEALKQVIEQFGKNETPILAYFALENFLCEQKGQPIEIQLAIAWGALWLLDHMQCIDCNMRHELYGKFLSRYMELI